MESEFGKINTLQNREIGQLKEGGWNFVLVTHSRSDEAIRNNDDIRGIPYGGGRPTNVGEHDFSYEHGTRVKVQHLTQPAWGGHVISVHLQAG